MQRGQTQVAGFCKGNRMLHRFAVANLAHQNHIRRLAQGIFQRRFPAIGVQTDFTLCNYAILVRMDKLNRVFNRDDMTVGLRVSPIHHGRQRRRLTRASRTDQNRQTALGHHNVFEHLGYT